MISNYKNSTNPKDIFGQFTDDVGILSGDNEPDINYCVAATKGCKGPSKKVKKRLVSCRGNILVFSISNTNNSVLQDFPNIAIFDNKRFVIRGCIGGNNIHFISYYKKEKSWVYYDGMERPMAKEYTEDSKILKKKT